MVSMDNYIQYLAGKYISFRPQGHGKEDVTEICFISKFLLSKEWQRPKRRLQSERNFLKEKYGLLTIKNNSIKKKQQKNPPK